MESDTLSYKLVSGRYVVQIVEDPAAADLRPSKGTWGWAGALQRDFENAVMQAIVD